MLLNREDVKRYAKKICLAMLEQTANRRVRRQPPLVIDALGYVPTFLEEACRPIWGLSAILRQEELYITVAGKKTSVSSWIQQVLIEGTDPHSPYSWDTYRQSVGEHPFAFQNLTETAGLFIGMYFARERLWDPIPEEKKQQIADWVFGCCKSQVAHIAGNNHVWFPLFNLLVLQKFGYEYPNARRYLQEGLEKLETMYLAQGWYHDGGFGRFDYYHAWSMHSYPLMWCLIEDESFPRYREWRETFIRRTERFLSHYLYWFDENGAHAPFGRSLAYRFAASCIFPLAVLCGCQIDPALAGRATLKNISYFEENALLNENGALPAGYLYDDAAVVENYTSDGGAYWCSKTFLCLLMDETHPFWQIENARLPIEKGSYLEKPAVETIRLVVGGTKHSGVTVFNNVCQYYQNGVYCNPFNDMAAYYNKFAYNSRCGFGISARDRTAHDNMIGVMTSDQSMCSHRWGFTDLGEKNGVLLSVHTPFSNDRKTLITTALLPLKSGWHVRLHKVVLSQPYRIREGGFSLGQWDDYCEETVWTDGCRIRGHQLESAMHAVGTAEMTFLKERIQPGLHLLAPQAHYPCYVTDELIPGVYYFACVCGVFDVGFAPQQPQLQLNGQQLVIHGTGHTIPLNWLDEEENEHGKESQNRSVWAQ